MGVCSLLDFTKQEKHPLPIWLGLQQLVLMKTQGRQAEEQLVLKSGPDTHLDASMPSTSIHKVEQWLAALPPPAAAAAGATGPGATAIQQPPHKQHAPPTVPHQSQQQASSSRVLPPQSQPAASRPCSGQTQQLPRVVAGAQQKASHMPTGQQAVIRSQAPSRSNGSGLQLQPAARRPSSAAGAKQCAAAALTMPDAKRQRLSPPATIPGCMTAVAQECRYPHAGQIEAVQHGSAHDGLNQGHQAEQGPGCSQPNAAPVSNGGMEVPVHSSDGRSVEAAQAASQIQLGTQHQHRRPNQDADAARSHSQRTHGQHAIRPGSPQRVSASDGNAGLSQAAPAAAAAAGLRPDSQGTQLYDWSQLRKAL